MDSYLLLKFLHVLGVALFIGGTFSSFLVHRHLEETTPPQPLRQVIRQIDVFGVTLGGWLLFLAGMTAALIAGVGIYHSMWVMVGFGIFLAQAGLAHAAVRINRRFLTGDLEDWGKEIRARIYLLINLALSIVVVFLMVAKI